MSARTLESLDAAPREFNSGRLGRLTWLGFFVAAAGWALLLGSAMIANRLATSAGASSAQVFHADLVEIARCLIGSGFGLAMIGALQTGFGALNRFFAAVLTRSAPRVAPAHQASVHQTSSQVESAPIAGAAVDRSAEPLRERRPYQILADGSVEVETIVGTRRFVTMSEARDFI